MQPRLGHCDSFLGQLKLHRGQTPILFPVPIEITFCLIQNLIDLADVGVITLSRLFVYLVHEKSKYCFVDRVFVSKSPAGECTHIIIAHRHRLERFHHLKTTRCKFTFPESEGITALFQLVGILITQTDTQKQPDDQ